MAAMNPRRRFLQQTAAFTVAAQVQKPERPGDQQQPISIIDTHEHLWDLARFKLPWLKAAPQLDRSFLPVDYRQAAEGLNVVKSIYMEVDVDPAQHVAEADYVLGLIDRGGSPLVAAVIGGRPGTDGFADYLTRYKNRAAVKGVRRVLHGDETPPGFCLERRFIDDVRALGKAGLSFDLCMRPAELGDACKLTAMCPDTLFILDHCGNASVRTRDLAGWKSQIARLAAQKNVVCKVSGIVASAAPGPWTVADLAPIVIHVLDQFGPDRVVFGGDWPVCTLAATFRQWVEALRAVIANRPISEQQKLFHENATRIYRLS